MSLHSPPRSMSQWLTAGAALAAGAYAGYVGLTWIRYGRAARPADDEEDSILDGFMPSYDVVERQHIHVGAPAAVTLAAAREMDLSQSRIVRAIFRGRELILGAAGGDRPRPKGLLADVQSLGWVVLAEVRDREIVVGAVTKPWEPNVTFRGIPPDQFARFSEPGYVKIAWTLRADPDGETASIFRTETRVIATDATARAKFRWYWSFLSPGIILIRLMSLCPVKAEAERRAQPGRRRPGDVGLLRA